MELFFLAILVLMMAGALASGFPVAFALPGSAILTVLLAAVCGEIFAGDASAYFFQGGPTDWLTAGVTNFRGIYWEPERDTLIAIPLFVFMGIALQRSKIAEDLLLSMARLFGPVPGGLGISVVFVGALLAATTGIVGATVVAMGLISLPAMMKNRYSAQLATGTIAASGTLGQIIPPSIVLIILADQLSSAVDQAQTARSELYRQTTGEFSLPSEFGITSTSAGDMFMGAIVPGLILVGLYMLYILVLAIVRPKVAPAVRLEEKMSISVVLRSLTQLVPPLVLIIAVLGSIITGVATVNQAGALGAIGAIIMAGYRLHQGQRTTFVPAILAIASLVAIFVLRSIYPLNVRAIYTTSDLIGILLATLAVLVFLVAVFWSLWRMFRIENTLQGVMIETAKTSALVFIILIGAAMLTAAFRSFGGEDLVKDFLINLPGGFWTQFIIVMLVIFVLGFFLDFIEIAVVVVPIVAPILLLDPEANITAVWLGVMIGLNIQTSFLTPPFGFALFYLRGVASAAISTLQIYRGVIPFIILQLAALGIVGLTPSLVNYLPLRLSLTGETAPPPVNPRLQYCMEQYVMDQYAEHGAELAAAIDTARALPFDLLPQRQQRDMEESLDQAASIPSLLEAIQTATAEVEERAETYRPLHSEVRALQSQISRIEPKIKDLETELGRTSDENGDRRQELSDKLAELKAEHQRLLDAIPADWDERHKAFLTLVSAEEKARQVYRRTTDQAYQPVQETLATLLSTAEFTDLEQGFAPLQAAVTEQDPAAEDLIGEQLRALDQADAGDDITEALSDMRREVRKSSPNWDKAQSLLDEAMNAYATELAWRQSAVNDLLPGLRTYDDAIRDTIGLRQQPRLPQNVALDVAGCSADHRDVSLSF